MTIRTEKRSRASNPRTTHRSKTDEERRIDAEIGLRIAHVRNVMANGADLRTFASELGVSSAAVHQWEHGSGITHYNLKRICDVYEISLEWLLTGIGRPRRSYENRMNLLSSEDQDEGYELLDGWFNAWFDKRQKQQD